MLTTLASSPRFLPRMMWADAASCAATGALQVAFTGALSRLTGSPSGLLVSTGVFLLAYAVVAALIASRQTPPRVLIGLVVIGNIGWAIGCVALIASGLLSLSAWGEAWLLAQAACVIVLAELQWTGLRRTRAGRALAAA